MVPGVDPPSPEASDSRVDAALPPHRRSGHARPWLVRARTLAFSLVGAVLAGVVFGVVRAPVGPFDATFSARPATSGETVVEVSPLGTIGLDTHDGPVRLRVRLDELRLPEAEAIARDPTVLEEVESSLVGDVRTAFWALARRLAAVTILGAVAGALVSSVSWRSAVAGMAAGSLLVVGVGAGVATTWRAEAVAEPRYSGLLAMAPQAIGDVGALLDQFGQYRAQLAELVGNLADLYAAGQDLPTFDPGRATIRLLHVSDIHLNPQAFDLVRQLVDQFKVDAVVDVGDLTDFGSDTESQFAEEISTVGVPYVFVRGNHDSRATQEAVAAQPNAVVLDGETVEVAGLNMWGVGDPRYTPDKTQPTGFDVEVSQAGAYAPTLAAKLRSSKPPEVDLVAVHDARIAANAGFLTPLILAGHTHHPRQDRIDEAILMVEGSTGGGGLRSLQGSGPTPLTATVLYFDPATRRLVAYDRVTVAGLGRTEARIERHLVREGAGAAPR